MTGCSPKSYEIGSTEFTRRYPSAKGTCGPQRGQPGPWFNPGWGICTVRGGLGGKEKLEPLRTHDKMAINRMKLGCLGLVGL